MTKNVLIVNFNTQELTDACIKSINKHVSGCSIYVFDNSDKQPFNNTFDNVLVFDNTNGQYIDFNKWLEQYPKSKKSREATKIYGSAKHCYTIEYCLKLIPGGFVLLDSDVLVKKDFSDLYDKGLVYAGNVEQQPKSTIKRVLPYICYINSDFCIKNNIHYFDADKMHGLYNTPKGEGYDTGAAFYLNAKNHKSKNINYEDYIIHLKGGSWFETLKAYTKAKKNKEITITPEEWLKKYRYLWDENYTEPIMEVEKKEEQPKPITPPDKKVSPVFNKEEFEAMKKAQEPQPKVITRLSKIRQEEIERRDAEKNDNTPTAHTVSIRPMLSHLKKDRHRVILKRK